MKNKISQGCFLLFFFLSIFILSACDNATKPSAKIGIISDPHYFSPQLLINDGTALEIYLAYDRKLLRESADILDSAIQELAESDMEIILVPGDLTKDGEYVGHVEVAEKLKQLETEGKKVYVVPGNHDIQNPQSFSYDGDSVTLVDTVTPHEFREIYKEFGYTEAIAADTQSLSYVVEPVHGLWIMGLDTCKYEMNEPGQEHEISGTLTTDTLLWVSKQLKRAARRGKRVFAFMHHNTIEHFSVHKLLFPDYVLDNNEVVAELFADMDMNILFTGHYHAQDIIKKESLAGKYLYEIETGSLITYPCPYRFVELTQDEKLLIETRRITDTDYTLPEGVTFQEYAYGDLLEGLSGLIYYSLTNGIFTVNGTPIILSHEDALMVTPLMADAFIAHYEGDEMPDAMTLYIIEQLMTDPDPAKQMLGAVLGSLWTDAAPADNTIVIDLVTGTVMP